MDKPMFDLYGPPINAIYAILGRRLKVAVVALLAIVALSSCGGGSGSKATGNASSVAVSRNSAETVFSAASSLSRLSVASESSQSNASSSAHLSSSSPSSRLSSVSSAASVFSRASVSSLSSRASAASVNSAASVQSSSPAAIASIEIAPGRVALSVGSEQQLVAVGKRSDNSLVNLYGQVSWRIISGGAVAAIDNSGLLKRLTAGTAEIEAKAQGKTAILRISSDVQNLSLGYDNTQKQWPKVNIYLWTGEGSSRVEHTGRWPGVPASAGAGNLWSYVVEASKLSNGAINVIFNDGSGNGGPAHQTDNLLARESAVYNGMWQPVNSATSVRVTVVDGAAQGGNTFAAGSVVTVVANTQASGSRFNIWSGASAAYIFTDPAKPEARFVVPDKVETMLLEAQSLVAEDPYKSARNWYRAQCVGCHGVNGVGGVNDPLNNLHESGDYTLASLAKRIRTTMPKGNVGQCSGDQPGSCAYDIASMIINNKWLPADACRGANCALDSRNMRLLTTEEYLNSVRDIFALNIDEAVVAPAVGDGTNRNFNTVSSLVLNYDRTLGYQMAAQEIAKQVINNKSFFALASDCASDARCVVTKLGKKIFRRTLSSDEINRYASLYTAADAGKAVLQGLLTSPYFMYRSEMGKLDPATNLYKLTPYEVATLLSYSFWASAPDDALLAAADTAVANNASLDIRAQLTRMLGNTSPERERADRGLRRFASGWLIDKRYSFSAAVSASLEQAFQEETIRFTMESIKDNLPYKTLLTANYTYANPELARYYGSATVTGGWAKSEFADRDPRRGAGLLGHGSFLASRTSGAENPSPIKRGLFVRGVLMCQELPPPLKAGVSIPREPGDSNRDANKRHTSDPACFDCHQYIDGIGFGFESYGSDARYRMDELLGNGMRRAIDASGAIKSLNSAETRLDSSSEFVSYQTVPQLANLIADSGQGAACYSRQFYRYIVGRDESSEDQSIIPGYSSGVRAGGGMREMLIDLATNPSFILRRQ